MRTYSIIEDEKGDKRIIPSKWLINNGENMRWPPTNEPDKVRKLVINLADFDDQWEIYPVTRWIREKDNYNEAVDTLKKGLDELPSDPDQLRKSRSLRNKKRMVNSIEEPKNMKNRTQYSDSEYESTSTDNENRSIVSKMPLAPVTLNVIETDLNKSAEKSIESNCSIAIEKLPNNADLIANIENIPEKKEIQTILDNLQCIIIKIINIRHYKKITKALKVNNSISDLQKQTLQLVSTIVKKQYVIEASLNKLQRQGIINTDIASSPIISETMNKYFPIDGVSKTVESTEGRLKNKEFFNKVVTYLSRKGGENIRDFIYRCLDFVMEDKQLMHFTFYGTNTKKAFSRLMVCSCIFHATKNQFTDAADEEIRSSLCARIDTATTRAKRAEAVEKNKNKRKTFIPIVPGDSEEE